MVFIHSRLIKSKQVRFQIFNTRHVNCYCSLLLFCVREINRFLEIPFRESRKILRVSRNSKLDPRFSKLETRSSILETRNSSLETRFSIRENIEDRGSSFESRLSTYICPVLYKHNAHYHRPIAGGGAGGPQPPPEYLEVRKTLQLMCQKI